MLIRNPNLHIRRFEFKYLLRDRDVDKIRRSIANFVTNDPNAQQGAMYPVISIYFDDYNYSCYQEKLAGLKIRRKFRIRTYNKKITSFSKVFLEIKRRDEAIIFKDRVPLKFKDVVDVFDLGKYEKIKPTSESIIANQFIGYTLKRKLQPVVIVSYLREAYLDSKNFSFRLTIDQNLSSAPRDELNFEISNLKEVLRGYSILEAKFNRIMPSWFGMIVRSFDLERIAFSKYCWALEECGMVRRSEIALLSGINTSL